MAIGALGILLAACSSAGSASTTTSTTTASGSKGSTSAAVTAYTKCLSQHGVTLPNFKGRRPSGGGGPEGGFTPGSGGTPGSGSFPGRGAGGFANNPKYAAAEKACASLRPKGGGFDFGGHGANSAAFAAYTNCLKLHGVTVTDGVPDRSSSAFAAASAACAALRPTPGSTTSTTAPTASG